MSLLKIISGLVSLAGSVFAWFTGAQQRKLGQQQQRLADSQATVSEAKDARKIESADDRLSTDELRASLVRDSSRPN